MITTNAVAAAAAAGPAGDGGGSAHRSLLFKFGEDDFQFQVKQNQENIFFDNGPARLLIVASKKLFEEAKTAN